MKLPANVWKLVFGLAAAVIGYALAQTEIVFDPAVKGALVAALAGLAALNPNRSAPSL
jgi:hypothetical protein